MIKIDDVLDLVKKYVNDKEKINAIYHAYVFAKKNHEGQMRKSGELYISHPLWTAYFLAQWHLSPLVIQCGLLHDVLEDTPVTYEELENEFGEAIAKIVKSLTKVNYFAKENRSQIKSRYLHKLYIAMARDIRVIVIKLADRLHNIKTLKYLSPEKQKIIAHESLYIYAVIAERLCMTLVKKEIEDVCFPILKPIEYAKIKKLIKDNNINQKHVKNINSVIVEIKNFLIQKNKF